MADSSFTFSHCGRSATSELAVGVGRSPEIFDNEVVYWTLYARTRSLYIPVHGRKWPCTAPCRKFAVYGSDMPVLHPPPPGQNPPRSRDRLLPFPGPVAPIPGALLFPFSGPYCTHYGDPPFLLPGLRCPAPEKSLPPLPGHISMF
ncbi:hypothetical protein Bbelb_099530 [Branchiostoma belcheri]|nr:hypothetical protein Bbelb_099530 [Branchiostoma belcheri]